jgi:cytochrome c-type biogenesis protein
VIGLSLAGASQYVERGPLPLAAGLSLLAGITGFLSPCVLPLVPGYLSYLAAQLGEGEHNTARRRAILGAGLFVLGFALIFVSAGVAFGAAGAQLRDHIDTVQRIFGAVTIALGFVYLGALPALQREVRIHRMPSPGRLVGAPLLGAAFALAWSPCLTPTVGAVLSMSYDQSAAARGAFLMFCYCVGLGSPFVLFAAGAGWFITTVSVIQRYRRPIGRVGGLLLIFAGLSLVTGTWTHGMDWLRGSTTL